MTSQRGASLILAMMMLAFLSILGSALLTTATIDVWIGDNYETGTQILYAAEAGIEDAREKLRTSPELEVHNGANYTVQIKHDSAQGVFRLVSTATMGRASKTIEAVVKQGGFPPLRSGLTFGGPVEIFVPPESNLFELQTGDQEIAGLDRLLPRIEAFATDVLAAPATIGSVGAPDDYRIVVVNGDAQLGNGTGYGVLIIRGSAAVTGNFYWNGLILIAGGGVLQWHGDGNGFINGAVFIARLDGGSVTADFQGANGAGIHFDPVQVAAANTIFPYNVIAVREH